MDEQKMAFELAETLSKKEPGGIVKKAYIVANHIMKIEAENEQLKQSCRDHVDIARQRLKKLQVAEAENERLKKQSDLLTLGLLQEKSKVVDFQAKKKQFIVACKLALNALVEKGECYAKAAIEQALEDIDG